jgi:hypothetical protein
MGDFLEIKVDPRVIQKANARFYGYVAISNLSWAICQAWDYKTSLLTPSDWAVEVLQFIFAGLAVMPYYRALDALDELGDDSANL